MGHLHGSIHKVGEFQFSGECLSTSVILVKVIGPSLTHGAYLSHCFQASFLPESSYHPISLSGRKPLERQTVGLAEHIKDHVP